MGAYVLRFTINGKTIDGYRNGKTWGISFFKQCMEDEVQVKGNKVTLSLNALNEAYEDALYYVRCKNEEYEDGEITKREYDSAHEWFDYHSEHLLKLIKDFNDALDVNSDSDDDDFYTDFTGEWVRLK